MSRPVWFLVGGMLLLWLLISGRLNSVFSAIRG